MKVKTAKERKQLEVLRNYIEKAILKTMEIQLEDWRLDKINAELTDLIDLLDEIEQ